MGLHTRMVVDFEKPLPNENHETFCQNYFSLDIDSLISNKRARRIKAYRLAFTETTDKLADNVVNSRAVVLLENEDVKDRLSYLYEQEGTSVESNYVWTKSKSEALLVDIALSPEQKTTDRLKAVNELNKMRGIESPTVVAEEKKTDSVDSFFEKFKGLISG